MPDQNHRSRGINLPYTFSQLAKALSSPAANAAKRVRKWQRVISGMLEGHLDIGSRTPTENPPWVTLEVAHGGFATGELAAGGPLLGHERELHDRLQAGQGEQVSASPPSGPLRTTLNTHYLGAAGRAELEELLASGRYQVTVPEEAAHLVITWLLTQDEGPRAAELIDTLVPYLHRLRFYPVPGDTAVAPSEDICLETVASTVSRLERRRPQAQVARMIETIQVWTPLYDRAAALFLETVEGDAPSFERDASGAWVRTASGNPKVIGGWPCRHFPTGWGERARALLADDAVARREHHLCKKWQRPKENYPRLRRYLEACAVGEGTSETLSGRDVGALRCTLAAYVSRHGGPHSDAWRAKRAEQAANASSPLHHHLAAALARRFEGCAQDRGDPNVDSRLHPIETNELEGAEAHELPRHLQRIALRCLEAPLSELIDRGLIPSGESLATLIPKLTATACARAIADPRLQRLYYATYTAFRRRRSLLLLDLQRQVSLDELPWIEALAPWLGGAAQQAAIGAVFDEVASRAIISFPQTLLSNNLIEELRTLAKAAGRELPLPKELAADIFMGTFGSSYLLAAKDAAKLLRGSLYARYFGIDYTHVLTIEDVDVNSWGTATSPAFDTLCHSRVPQQGNAPRFTAHNGMIIEQAQILTTHNLATLYSYAGVREALAPRHDELAKRCFSWICRQLQRNQREHLTRLRTVKNCAYAWRQMLFHLSFVDAVALQQFQRWAKEHLDAQGDELRRRLCPVVGGLEDIAGGLTFDGEGGSPRGRRLLGWASGHHWLLAEA